MGIPHDVGNTDTVVRRSSRSNKGQHSKFAGRGKKRKIDIVEEDDGETRCLCGDNEDDGEFMIQCESCRKWQHGMCMGFKDPKKVREPYACEICRPDQYKDVSVKEEGTKKTEKTTGKKKPPPKEKTVQPVTKVKLIFKKPEKRKTPPSDESSDDDSAFTSDEDDVPIMELPSKRKIKTSPSITTPPPTKAKSPSTEPRKKPPPINTARRPSQASPQQQRRPSAAEQRRSSTSATPSTPHPLAKTPLATTFSELSDQKRVPAARIFAKIFEPIDSTKSEALGLAIEHALYSAFATSEHGYGEAYKNKFRSISFNLKDPKNSALRERVLTGQLPTEDLVKMSSEDMANQELREQAEKIREEGVAQSVLKVQTGPRIRRTHKGEEIVGGDDMSAITPTEGTASAPFAPRVEKMSPSVRGEEEVPASPRSVESIGSRNFSPPHQDTEMTDITSTDRKPSNFDLENVWSHLRSPTFHNDEPTSELMDLDILPDDLPQNQIDDPDIDRIINEDPTNNSPPYSPSAYEYQLPNTADKYPPIWTGDLAMPSVAHFAAQARFVGGPHSVTDLPWSTILPQHLVIDGRIAIDTTTKYLAAQRSSSTKDIIVIQIAAEQTHKELHRKLFQYFHDRQRYGVLQIQSNIVRDAYIVPLAPDQPIPEAVESMDSHDIPRSRTEPYILAILVISKQIPTEISRSPVTGFSPGVAAPPPVTSPPTAEIATQQFSPLGASPFTAVAPSQQPVSYSPPAVSNPIEALGLSTADLAALQGVLIAHPEILNNPQILTNPTILQNVIQQHLSGQRW